MRHEHRLKLIGVVISPVVCASIISAAPSLATVSGVTVRAGTKTGTVAVAATSTNNLFVKIVRNNAPFTCPAGIALSGSSSTGNGRSPFGVMSIASSAWPSGCKFSASPVTFTQITTPWSLNAKDHSVPTPTSTTPAANQVTLISLTNFGVRMQASTCRFDVKGTVYGNYTNTSTPTLALKVANSTSNPVVPQADLTISNIVLSGGATNCLAGLILNGDKMIVSTDTSFNVGATQSGSAANPLWMTALP